MAMFYRQSYDLLRAQAKSEDRLSMKIQVVILIVVVWVLPIVISIVWFVKYYTDSAYMLALIRDAEKLTVRVPTQGFVITMHNETGYRVAEELKVAFGIQDMHVVMGHVGNYSTLSLYNRHVMRHGQTDTLQIENLNMLGCLESHREVWTRVRDLSYVFEDDAVPTKHALSITKMLLHDSAGKNWSVIHLDIPGGFFSGSLLTPDRAQYEHIGRVTETCRDCIAYSTRGYILTKEAAQILLQNYEPPVVQVDSYMSLLNAYHGSFKQLWTRVQAVDERPHTSDIQHYNEPIQIMYTIANFLIPQH
jgi:hypothetical protein